MTQGMTESTGTSTDLILFSCFGFWVHLVFHGLQLSTGWVPIYVQTRPFLFNFSDQTKLVPLTMVHKLYIPTTWDTILLELAKYLYCAQK